MLQLLLPALIVINSDGGDWTIFKEGEDKGINYVIIVITTPMVLFCEILNMISYIVSSSVEISVKLLLDMIISAGKSYLPKGR